MSPGHNTGGGFRLEDRKGFSFTTLQVLLFLSIGEKNLCESSKATLCPQFPSWGTRDIGTYPLLPKHTLVNTFIVFILRYSSLSSLFSKILTRLMSPPQMNPFE